MILRYVAAFRREVTFWFQMSTLGRKIDAKSSRFLPRQLLVTGANLVWGLVFVAPFLIRQDVSLELRGYAGYPAIENWASVTRQVAKCIVYGILVYWYKLDSCCHSEWILPDVDGMALMVGSSPGGPRQPEMYSAWLPDVLSLADLRIKFKKKRWNAATN